MVAAMFSSRVPNMREFFGVPPLASVALLAVNDNYLKAAFHNAITGKLSDFGGCFFLPLYVSALLSLATRWSLQRRLATGAVVTTVLFSAVSLSPSAAGWVCDAVLLVARPLGISMLRIASDPTDLIALPFIALAVAYGWKVARPSPAPLELP
jgi:hypothetical protein